MRSSVTWSLSIGFLSSALINSFFHHSSNQHLKFEQNHYISIKSVLLSFEIPIVHISIPVPLMLIFLTLHNRSPFFFFIKKCVQDYSFAGASSQILLYFNNINQTFWPLFCAIFLQFGVNFFFFFIFGIICIVVKKCRVFLLFLLYETMGSDVYTNLFSWHQSKAVKSVTD